MVTKLHWLPKPVIKTLRVGKHGHMKVKAVATYKRKIDGHTHTSYHVPALDKLRHADKAGKGMRLGVKHHHDYEHMTDSPKTNL